MDVPPGKAPCTEEEATMWHYVTMLVAAAFFAMAACDSENVPGEEPGPITTADTWSAADSGKGDDPAPIDAVDTMADTESVPDIVRPLPEVQCPAIAPLGQGIWYREDRQNGETVTLDVVAQASGKCLTTANRPKTTIPSTIIFDEGNELPLSMDLPDSTVTGGHVKFSLHLEGPLLKIKAEHPEGGYTLSYKRP